MIARCLIAVLLLASAAIAQPVAIVRHGGGVGSATLIAKDDKQAGWLTARHVIDGQQGHVYVWPHKYPHRYLVREIVRHPSLDVAYLVTSSTNLDQQPIAIGTEEDCREPALISGYSHGTTFQGRHVSYQQKDATGREIIWRGVAIPGQSGGPIFVPRRLVLLGVVSGSDGAIVVGPYCQPIRNWLRTLGWRFRRARTQAAYYSGLDCSSGQCRIIYPENPEAQEPTDEPIDEPPAARPYGGTPTRDPISLDDIDRRLSKVEVALAEPTVPVSDSRVDDHAERIAKIEELLKQFPDKRIDEQEAAIASQRTKLEALRESLLTLTDAVQSHDTQVKSLAEQLSLVMSDLAKLRDKVSAIPTPNLDALLQRIDTLESRGRQGEFSFVFGPKKEK
jgi:archaellum component FlaC